MSPSGSNLSKSTFNPFNLRREKHSVQLTRSHIDVLMDATSPETAPEPIRFRAGKKRKAYRQRAQEEEDTVTETIQSPPAVSASVSSDKPAQGDTPDDGDDDREGSVAAALKLRNARRGRLGGVAFRNTGRPDDDTNSERALVLPDVDDASNAESVIKGVTDRFTHQTGRLADLNDRHMYVGALLHLRSILLTMQQLIIQGWTT
jgi:hypothetical protein